MKHGSPGLHRISQSGQFIDQSAAIGLQLFECSGGGLVGDSATALQIGQPRREFCGSVHSCGGRRWLAAIAADPCIIASQRTCGTFVAAGNDEMQWTESDHRREQWVYGGWNVGDDDAPKPPEPDPLSSAQSRRFWLQSAPTSSHQCEPYSWHVPQDAPVARHT
jgi:hypothetical protein